MFATGKEWVDACRLILSFVKANSAPKVQVSVSLGPRWFEATDEGKGGTSDGEGKKVGEESESEGKKRKTRACETRITRWGG